MMSGNMVSMEGKGVDFGRVGWSNNRDVEAMGRIYLIDDRDG